MTETMIELVLDMMAVEQELGRPELAWKLQALEIQGDRQVLGHRVCQARPGDLVLLAVQVHLEVQPGQGLQDILVLPAYLEVLNHQSVQLVLAHQGCQEDLLDQVCLQVLQVPVHQGYQKLQEHRSNHPCQVYPVVQVRLEYQVRRADRLCLEHLARQEAHLCQVCR